MDNKYTYVGDATSSHHGTMKCTVCGKSITEGAYRVSENDNGYHTQHRHCTEHDKEWKAIDAARERVLKDIEWRLSEFQKFKALWATDALDEEIEQMQYFIESNRK